MKCIDLNCDLGEGFENDAEIMPFISSANIACGAHAGSLETMIEAVECATKYRVMVGAHPGYFDLQNFGRVEPFIEDYIHKGARVGAGHGGHLLLTPLCPSL